MNESTSHTSVAVNYERERGSNTRILLKKKVLQVDGLPRLYMFNPFKIGRTQKKKKRLHNTPPIFFFRTTSAQYSSSRRRKTGKCSRSYFRIPRPRCCRNHSLKKNIYHFVRIVLNTIHLKKYIYLQKNSSCNCFRIKNKFKIKTLHQNLK